MSDSLALGIVTVVGTLTTTLFTGIMAYLMARLNQQQAVAAAKVQEVAVSLADNTEKTTETLNVIQKTGEQTKQTGQEILKDVNSAKTKMEEKLDAAQARIEGLEKLLSVSQEKTRVAETSKHAK